MTMDGLNQGFIRSGFIGRGREGAGGGRWRIAAYASASRWLCKLPSQNLHPSPSDLTVSILTGASQLSRLHVRLARASPPRTALRCGCIS